MENGEWESDNRERECCTKSAGAGTGVLDPNCSGNPHNNSKWRMITRIKGLHQIRQAICALSRRSNHHGRLIEFLSQRF